MRRKLRLIPRPLAIALAIVGACTFVSDDSRAQSAGVQRPMPDVLLLVDTSGSMERMPDNTLPSANAANKCTPGVESSPNRWGMLVQALTGNIQPYYSCYALDRGSTKFKDEYKIGGVTPYDANPPYALPYHRPLSGDTNSACAVTPGKLPGGVNGTLGVGTTNAAYPATGDGSDVRDFPDDAIANLKFDTSTSLLTATSCLFSQTPDGQLDAARDYVRFALMTFDNSTDNEMGVNNDVWPPQGAVNADPFKGQWSYRRADTNPLFSTDSTFTGTPGRGSAQGRPLGCPDLTLGGSVYSVIPPFEVGARHWGAPPWEGRMVPFPASDATLLEIQQANERVQKVLLATRPYGATPIDGMMDDARDYYWYNAIGPASDPYIKTAPCRDQYIILLTDGAPNLNLKPACGTGASAICPYPQDGASIAADMFAPPAGKRKITTYVIGFSVNADNSAGDGFPTGYAGPRNCKSWYEASDGGKGSPKTMAEVACSPMPAEGTTANACCMLNKIAFEGSGGGTDATGPFFAESQSDIVLSFGKILATVTKAVSTRTVPTYTPSAYAASGFGANSVTAQYLGSFIPNAQKPWSGEIARQRSMCTTSSGPLTPKPVDRKNTEGDSEAINLATQGAAKRLFITYVPDSYSVSPGIGSPASTSLIDGAGTIRPFVTSKPDGIPDQAGDERGGTDLTLTVAADFRLALQIDSKSCKRGRAIGGATGTTLIPALNMDNGKACSEVVWGFAVGHLGKLPAAVTTDYDFNVRCTGSSAVTGKCSITGTSCTLSNPGECTGASEPQGQVCVPECAPLGAIFHANLAISGPPDGVLRDSGYRAFQSRRSKRRPVLYAATTDGILHAFKAVEQATDAEHELWSFVPPAILPRLASNYPAGNQILLDGTPVVKDTVWDRISTDVDGSSPGSKWHTTLVAGLGVEGGGYYAVNVTDADCSADPTKTKAECTATWEKATTQDQAGAGTYAPETQVAKPGPHFLWQLTDLPPDPDEKARVIRTRQDGKERVSLFGRQTGTPAIGTAQLGTHQIGIAILPGGIDGSPVKNGECKRVATDTEIVADKSFPVREKVRQWGKDCDQSVPGRTLTIVRLDSGEIIRTFGRIDDIPKLIPTEKRIYAPFDAPMIGTPVVYPQAVGAVVQKIFVGDADGTLWRIDISNTDSSKWKAELFADLVNPDKSAGAAQSQPVSIPPVLSLEPGGALVVNVATGEQENVLFHTNTTNYVWSILESRPISTDSPKASVRWYQTLEDGHRVTGPMTVFDRTLYFASFKPRDPSSASGAGLSCENAGTAYLWGLNYYLPETLDKPASGGKPQWCADADTGVCTSASLTINEEVKDPAGFIIPGVTLTPTQACSEITGAGDELGNAGFQSISPASFTLSFGVSTAGTPSSSLPPSALLKARTRPLPRMATAVNAWAILVD